MAQIGQDEAAAGAPALQLVGIEKRFGRIEALRGADLSVHAGQIVGLCGDSGSGKSTLVKLLAGLFPTSSYRGQVVRDGQVERLGSPEDSKRLGIAVIHQRGTLVPQLSVAENLFLGREPRRFGLVDEPALLAAARAELERFGLSEEISPFTRVGELGAGLQQIVAIVRALSGSAKILVLDEPAAALLPPERDRLFGWLRALKKHGAACLYVAHRMDELIGLCDQITILRDGTTAKTLNGSPQKRAAGRYLVHDEIASGGMATVHLGKIRGPFGFTSTVAIKRLHPLLARDPDFVAMFLDEARLASRVRHPNVVPVLDVFADERELSLVMEYVEGESLAELARSSAGKDIPVAIAVAIVTAVLHGLHAAHEAMDESGTSLGLVHRDVSPQNVLVGSDGVARLIDFGIAKAACRGSASKNGQLKGKVAYMAPEQIRGAAVDRRVDVYGASVLLWELLAGEKLFDGETEGMILGRVLDDVVPAPSSLRSDVPRALDAAILRGLSRAPDARHATARELARELEAAVRPAPAAELADWVQSLAEPALRDRASRLARMEREALGEDEPRARPETASIRPRVESGFWARWLQSLDVMIRGDRARSR